ncbi:MAG: DUF418 domain-containing protein [Pseudonocardia sp.]
MIQPAPVPGPTALADRAPAPDLARGLMLLLIALANAHLYLYDRPVGVRGYPVDLDPASRVVTLAQMLLVDGRAYPLFALLLGYGVVQLARRRPDPADARRVVRRRGWWLLLFGLVHASLLFAGDILGVYGLLSVLLATRLITGSDRSLLVLWGIGLTGAALLGTAMGLPVPPDAGAFLPSMGTSTPLPAALFRTAEFVVLLLTNSVLVSGAVALGAWAARRRLLEDPALHRNLLRRVAVVGLAAAALGGLPMALMSAGWWTDPGLANTMAAGALHTATGHLGGAGYAVVIALWAHRVAERPGLVTRALQACGQRSLSCYLAQSVVFVAVLAAYGGGLGDRLSVAGTAAVAAAAWAAILAAAALMRRAGQRGPAEVLLRRLTYRTG